MSLEVAGVTLNQEDYGQIQKQEYSSRHITQGDIVKSVDVQSAEKRFTLDLRDFGPYTFDFTPNGRHLALAGRRGHVATVDWQPKKLSSEFNVRERIRDICYFHNSQMYAVAQNKAVFVYDNLGIQIHALDKILGPTSLNFLQQHFLLATGTQSSRLIYLDISLGKIVKEVRLGRGPITLMTTGKQNAIQHVATTRGTVGLWCPSVPDKEPLVEILCHKAPITSLAVDDSGQYLATSATDHCIKIWDLRTYQCLHVKKMPAACSSLAYSNTGVLAAAYGRHIVTFKESKGIYLKHYADGTINKLKFCPFEDVLGVGHSAGYESVLIPGSGEANIDSYEANPYQSKQWQKEKEVKQLLDKIPWQLISLNTDQLSMPRQPQQRVMEESEITRFSKVNSLQGDEAMNLYKRVQMRQKQDDRIEKRRKETSEALKDAPYDALDRFRSTLDKIKRAKMRTDQKSETEEVKAHPKAIKPLKSSKTKKASTDNTPIGVVKKGKTKATGNGSKKSRPGVTKAKTEDYDAMSKFMSTLKE